ncbi:hypothetical protein K3495_g11756 [Podosphaera aphanis]|nr:hypothetical protein K3495_g11756 [Podosphaera aphanis]
MVWSNAKREKFLQDETSAWYEIRLCLDDIDLGFVKEFNTTNAKWNALIKKYTKSRPATNRETVKKITAFTFEPDETLERGWTKIREYRRRVVEETPQLAEAYSEEHLFDFFVQALPPEYKITRQTIDGKPFLPVLDKLDVLYGAEDEIRTSKDKEIAMAARYKDHHQNRSCGTKFYDNRHHRRHPKHDCPYQEAVEKFAIALRIRDKRLKAKNRVNGETQSKRPDNTSKGDYRQVRHQSSSNRAKRRRHKAYAAEEFGSESDNFTSGSNQGSFDETAAVSREQIRKSRIPPSSWVSDTAASSHMTDNSSLFRESQIPLSRRRRIQVGGGELHTDFKGTVELRPPGVEYILLSDVLYVPNLDVNLLSGRHVCQKGLVGSFNDKSMYFSLKEKIVVTATLSGGVYIVSEIAPDFDEVALAADDTLNLNYTSSSHEISEDDRTHDLSDDDGRLNKNERARWRKYHRRIGHFGIGKLRHPHEFSNLKRPIRDPKWKDICTTGGPHKGRIA